MADISQPASAGAPRLKFDWTVNVQSMLALGAIAVSAWIGASSWFGQVHTNTAAIEQHGRDLARIEQARREDMEEIRQRLASIERVLMNQRAER